ncbi:MAG: hypothetical protein RLZZ200_420 [Pseudomonadota bacterium]|jgi:hypothetical protein
MGNTSRRDFLRSGGTALGAGVAVTTGLDAATVPTPAEDLESIRALLRNPQAGLWAVGGAVTYRPRLDTQPDRIALAPDGLSATAVLPVEAEIVEPLQGNSTLEQMARLEGHVARRRIEAGQIEVDFDKNAGTWRLRSTRFLPA